MSNPRKKVRATPPCKAWEPPVGGWRTPNADKRAAEQAVEKSKQDNASAQHADTRETVEKDRRPGFAANAQ